jgi:hypothetical protein
MSSNTLKETSFAESILITFVFSFLAYLFASLGAYLGSSLYMGESFAISSSFLWNVVLVNALVTFCILIFMPVKFQWRVVGLLAFFAVIGYFDVYKQSTIRYYLGYGTYMNPELYPENSNQRKLINDVIAHKDLDLFGEYNTTYFQKADINKLGNMTNFFMTYGQRNEQMKAFEAKFKELLNVPFLTAWDYAKFEDEVVDYLISNPASLQRSETVSMVHTIKFGV